MPFGTRIFMVTWFTNFRKLKGGIFFSFQFRKIITLCRRTCIGYNLIAMRQSACLVFNPVMVNNYAAFFNCSRWVGRQSMMPPPHKKVQVGNEQSYSIWLRPELLACCLTHRGSTGFYLLLPCAKMKIRGINLL